MKTFLKKFFLYIILPGAAFIGLWLMIFFSAQWANVGILNLQMAKLKHFKKKHFNIIFIGDSSGGFGIAADNKTTVNLCLTRSFGFEGASTFLDIIDKYITYDTIVVINALDVCTRNTSSKGIWLPQVYADVNPVSKAIALKNTFKFFKPIVADELQHNFYWNEPMDPKRNYMTSTYKVNMKENIITRDLLPKKLNEFQALENKIKEKNKVYFLLHGPSLPYQDNYFEKLNQALKDKGIKHQFNRPYLLSTATVGSTENHVHPDYVAFTTRYYLDLVRSGGIGDGGI